MDEHVTPSNVGTRAEHEEVLDWYAKYDAAIAEGDVETMADMAMFPLNEVTDGEARGCTREEFVRHMRELIGDGGGISMNSTRTPHFISPGLAFVMAESTITSGEVTKTVRYADLLVRLADGWRFQTMVQAGWGEN